ncbi:D-serine dehydratase [Choanephora cucurbitarum]|uniref:D-serine dehydratase n=1 Tax=Choanephora cucurbitarum TaxID=101091 RepID=A0A1C7NI57_9FUNG|nr:D-serine dehydratase [Choanephora cucurbitarum]
MMVQTKTHVTPIAFNQQWKATLAKDYIGKKLTELRTPSLVISRTVLQRNSERLREITTKFGLRVRIHVKTHKTTEGAQIQLKGVTSDAIVVSTLPEAHSMVDSDLVKEGLLKEVLVGFPITADKLEDVFELSKRIHKLQIFVDNLNTLEDIEAYLKTKPDGKKHQHHIHVFLKADCGYGRAGALIDNATTIELAKRLQDSPYLTFEGIYTHAGHSYSSESPQDALEYLKNECNFARQFRDFLQKNGVRICCISIGATPTVKAITVFMDQQEQMRDILKDIDEVHAGAFGFLDRQQVATGLGSLKDVSISVAVRIASVYPDQRKILVDGGALAFSKDTAPQGGFGYVVDMNDRDCLGNPKVIASVTKVAQEHGLLQDVDEAVFKRLDFQIGSVLRVIPNHCCLTAACHPFYLIVEDDDTVVDVWVPVRGW